MAQYGIKEVMDFYLTNFHNDPFKRVPLVYVDYAQVTSVGIGGERHQIDGGRGNSTLMSFDHSKSALFNLTLPLVDLKMLALISGDDVEKKIKEIYKRDLVNIQTDAQGNKFIMLEKEPIIESIHLYNLDACRDHGQKVCPALSEESVQLVEGEYALDPSNPKKILLAKDHAPKTDTMICYYHYETKKTVETLRINPEKFPKAVSFYGDALWRDQCDECDEIFHVVGHKGRILPEYELTMSGTDSAVLELTLEMYAINDPTDNTPVYVEYIRAEDQDCKDREESNDPCVPEEEEGAMRVRYTVEYVDEEGKVIDSNLTERLVGDVEEVIVLDSIIKKPIADYEFAGIYTDFKGEEITDEFILTEDGTENIIKVGYQKQSVNFKIEHINENGDVLDQSHTVEEELRVDSDIDLSLIQIRAYENMEFAQEFRDSNNQKIIGKTVKVTSNPSLNVVKVVYRMQETDYSIKYVNKDGEIIDEKLTENLVARIGDRIDFKNIPIKTIEDYEFQNKFTNEEDEEIFGLVLSPTLEDNIIKVVYDKKEVQGTVIHKSEDGTTIGESYNIFGRIDDKVTLSDLKKPSIPHYEFTNVFNDKEGNVISDFTFSKNEEDNIIVLVYEDLRREITVEYVEEVGEELIPIEGSRPIKFELDRGEKLQVSAFEDDIEFLTFSKALHNGEEFTTITIEEDTTVEMVYVRDTYKLTIKHLTEDGEKVLGKEDSSLEYLANSTVQVEDLELDTEAIGYSFLGTRTDLQGENVSSVVVNLEDTILYCVYEPKEIEFTLKVAERTEDTNKIVRTELPDFEGVAVKVGMGQEVDVDFLKDKLPKEVSEDLRAIGLEVGTTLYENNEEKDTVEVLKEEMEIFLVHEPVLKEVKIGFYQEDEDRIIEELQPFTTNLRVLVMREQSTFRRFIKTRYPESLETDTFYIEDGNKMYDKDLKEIQGNFALKDVDVEETIYLGLRKRRHLETHVKTKEEFLNIVDSPLNGACSLIGEIEIDDTVEFDKPFFSIGNSGSGANGTLRLKKSEENKDKPLIRTRHSDNFHALGYVTFINENGKLIEAESEGGVVVLGGKGVTFKGDTDTVVELDLGTRHGFVSIEKYYADSPSFKATNLEGENIPLVTVKGMSDNKTKYLNHEEEKETTVLYGEIFDESTGLIKDEYTEKFELKFDKELNTTTLYSIEEQ